MLKDLTSEKLIQLRKKAKDWQEAIRIAMDPLVKEGFVKPGYVDAVIKNVQEMGPYIVITKHVALPHAQVEAGALVNAIGITTLAVPVKFGNKDNDPVKYLFSLSATNSRDHLSALADLADLIENQKFFTMLDQAESNQDVMNYLKKNSQEGKKCIKH